MAMFKHHFSKSCPLKTFLIRLFSQCQDHFHEAYIDKRLNHVRAPDPCINPLREDCLTFCMLTWLDFPGMLTQATKPHSTHAGSDIYNVFVGYTFSILLPSARSHCISSPSKLNLERTHSLSDKILLVYFSL